MELRVKLSDNNADALDVADQLNLIAARIRSGMFSGVNLLASKIKDADKNEIGAWMLKRGE